MLHLNIPSMPSLLWIVLISLISCESVDSPTDPEDVPDCTDVSNVVPLSERGACTESLSFSPEVSIRLEGETRTITSNSIPAHQVGLFGGGGGSLNPNAIAPVSDTYTLPAHPALANTPTMLLDPNSGPLYEFGILLNGVLLDPEAAEPWPHDGIFSFSTKNWEWNLDAMRINLGLDCNNAHVQPTGKYHYHGAPTLYLEGLDFSANAMTLIGYAADGFPIYYKYAYQEAENANSGIAEMASAYRLKSGERPGDGETAPCGAYSGIYTGDFEYVSGLGDLDECNGRSGVTPEYPGGTYYYLITDSFPFVPRCLRGSPSVDFRLRP